jgi:peptidoglycan/LPS O-acetylase OafA/YrhL
MPPREPGMACAWIGGPGRHRRAATTVTDRSFEVNESQKRVNLDWIRGLAALLVCALHAREITWIGLRHYTQELSNHNPFDIALAFLCAPVVWGSIGVTVFFVLSGYVIHAGTAAQLVKDRNWKLDAGRFYTRRIIRIYPVLIGALALTYALDSMSAMFAPLHDKLGPLSITTLIGNLFSLQSTVVAPLGSNGPLWTLAIEIQFYALYPLLLMARRRFDSRTLLAASAVVAVVSYRFLEGPGMEWFTSYYFFWILGFYAAELRARGLLQRPRAALGWAGLATTLAGCGVFFMSMYFGQFLWAIGFFLCLLNLLAKPPREGRLIRGLTAVGVFSYTLYATHFPIVVFLHATMAGGAKTTSMAIVLLYIAATVFISYLVFLVFERPSLDWLAGRRPSRIVNDPGVHPG